MKILAALLQAYAREKDLKQVELAKKIGITKNELSRIINLKSVNDRAMLKTLAWITK